jgi:hypothetical protein
MPTNVKVIHQSEFVRARPDGSVDLETAERLLADIARASLQLDEFEVLVDLRNISGTLKPEEVWQLAARLIRYRDTFLRKTAILCPIERFDRGRLFALLAASHGFHRVKAFVAYEDAMEWLMSGE